MPSNKFDELKENLIDAIKNDESVSSGGRYDSDFYAKNIPKCKSMKSLSVLLVDVTPPELMSAYIKQFGTK